MSVRQFLERNFGPKSTTTMAANVTSSSSEAGGSGQQISFSRKRESSSQEGETENGPSCSKRGRQEEVKIEEVPASILTTEVFKEASEEDEDEEIDVIRCDEGEKSRSFSIDSLISK